MKADERRQTRRASGYTTSSQVIDSKLLTENEVKSRTNAAIHLSSASVAFDSSTTLPTNENQKTIPKILNSSGLKSSSVKSCKNSLQYRPYINDYTLPSVQPESLESSSSLFKRESLRMSKKKSQMKRAIKLRNIFENFDVEEKFIMEFKAPPECYKSLIVTNNSERPKYELDFVLKESLNQTASYFYIARAQNIIYTTLGQPRSIQLGSEGVLYIGTAAGFVVIYNVITNSIAKLELTFKDKLSPITCIKLSTDLSHLLVGQESGEIIIWDLKRRLAVRTITFNDNAAILTFSILRLDPVTFVVSNNAGRVYRIHAQKSLFGEVSYSETLLLNKSLGAVIDIRTIQITQSSTDAQSPVNSQLVAMATLSKVAVLTFNPDPHITSTFSVDTFNEADTYFPYIAWGWVQSQVYEFLALAIGCGRVLEIVRFSIEEEIIWRKVKHFVFKRAIISVEFIKPGLLCVVDKAKVLHLLNFQDMKHGACPQDFETRSKSTPQYGHYQEEVPGYPLAQRHIQTLQGTWPKSYHQSVYLHSKTGDIFMLCEQTITRFHFYTPVEFLNAIQEQKKYKKFLTVSVDLIYGNLREVYAPPTTVDGLSRELNPELFAYFKEKLLSCVYHKLFKLTQSGSPEILTSNTVKIHKAATALIDFCLEINFSEYLFTIIKKSFQVIGLNNHFLNALEPFIMMNRVKHIPEPQLYEIITYYHEDARSVTVQRLFVNLDLSKTNVNQLVNLCFQLELLMPLAHVSSKGTANYLTPLVKTLNEFNKYFSSKQIALAEKHCLDVYWYMRLCLQCREVYSTDCIPHTLWKSIIKEMLLMIFKKEKLSQLLKTSAFPFTSTVLLFFEERPSPMIRELQGTIVLNSGRPTSLQIYRKVEELDLYDQMYEVIVQCLTDRLGYDQEERERLGQCLHFFNAVVAELGKSNAMSQKLALETALSIIQNPLLLPSELITMHFTAKDVLNTSRPGEYVEVSSEEDFCLVRRDELALALTKYCAELIKSDQTLRAAFTKAIELSSLYSTPLF